MKKPFNKVVNEVIAKCDVILQIVDARFITEMQSDHLVNKIREYGKAHIKVINKCDYLSTNDIKLLKKNLKDHAFVVATQKKGIVNLLSLIRSKGAKFKKEQLRVGIVGYPNVGKSTLINALKGRKTARTSSEAGYTKGKQYFKISEDIMMIDTPGVMPYHTKVSDLTIVGGKNPSTVKDPDLVVIKLLKLYPGRIEKHYHVPEGFDKDLIIESIAKKLNLLKKGKAPDIDRASRTILFDWQRGKIKKIN